MTFSCERWWVNFSERLLGLSCRDNHQREIARTKAPWAQKIICGRFSPRNSSGFTACSRASVLPAQPQYFLAQPGLGVGEIPIRRARRNAQQRCDFLQIQADEIRLLHELGFARIMGG